MLNKMHAYPACNHFLLWLAHYIQALCHHSIPYALHLIKLVHDSNPIDIIHRTTYSAWVRAWSATAFEDLSYLPHNICRTHTHLWHSMCGPYVWIMNRCYSWHVYLTFISFGTTHTFASSAHHCHLSTRLSAQQNVNGLTHIAICLLVLVSVRVLFILSYWQLECSHSVYLNMWQTSLCVNHTVISVVWPSWTLPLLLPPQASSAVECSSCNCSCRVCCDTPNGCTIYRTYV